MWRTWGRKRCIKILVRKPAGRRTLGKPRRRWKYNMKLILDRMGRRGPHFCGSCFEQVAGSRELWRENFGFHQIMGNCLVNVEIQNC